MDEVQVAKIFEDQALGTGATINGKRERENGKRYFLFFYAAAGLTYLLNHTGRQTGEGLC